MHIAKWKIMGLRWSWSAAFFLTVGFDVCWDQRARCTLHHGTKDLARIFGIYNIPSVRDLNHSQRSNPFAYLFCAFYVKSDLHVQASVCGLRQLKDYWLETSKDFLQSVQVPFFLHGLLHPTRTAYSFSSRSFWFDDGGDCASITIVHIGYVIFKGTKLWQYCFLRSHNAVCKIKEYELFGTPSVHIFYWNFTKLDQKLHLHFFFFFFLWFVYESIEIYLCVKYLGLKSTQFFS